MSSIALKFNDVTFQPVAANDEQIWITSSQLAKALGYEKVKSVTNLYNNNKDEFKPDMTEVTDSMTSPEIKGLRSKIRIFSLRGAYLIAMFARTKIAKRFRIWVLDVLEQESKTTADQRTPLRKACDSLAVSNMLISDAYKLVAKEFEVDNIEQIPSNRLAEAVAFAYETKLRLQKTETKQAINQEKLYELCANYINLGMEHFTLVHNIGISMANSSDTHLKEIASKVKEAINFSKDSELKNRRNQPMIEYNELNFLYGGKATFPARKLAMIDRYAG